MIDRLMGALQLRGFDEDRRQVFGVATTPDEDRAGDVVEPSGVVYSLPLPFLLDHDHRECVGEVVAAEVTPAGIKFTAQIARVNEPGKLKDKLDECWAGLKAGLRKTVSIGFRPLESKPLTGGALGARRFTSWEWLELSACVVPMNPAAKITAVRSALTLPRALGGGAHVAKLTPDACTALKVETAIAEAADRRKRLGIPLDHQARPLSPHELEIARLEAAVADFDRLHGARLRTPANSRTTRFKR
jgi:hypothetical protein